MRIGGQSRKRIARRLGAAYATGLLSEETYVGRLDDLLGSPLIEPARIDGDLNLRRRANGWVESAQQTVSASLERLHLALSGDAHEPPPPLLALDWSGCTDELSVGRHDACDVVVADPAVSRRHARLRHRDGRWIIQDLTSRNGSFVNGVRVGRSELRPGDLLTLGDTSLLVD